jgi:hypothetical protein
MKNLFLFLAPALLFSQTQQTINVTPGQPIVPAGASIKIAADRPVSFSLSGVGAIAPGPDSNTIVYTAPKGFTPQHVLHGCMVGPDDSVFNPIFATMHCPRPS